MSCCRAFALLAGLLTVGPVVAARADDKKAPDDFVTAALAKEIIGPRQTLAETIDHVGVRIPTMPAVKTAAEWMEYAARTRADVFERVIFRGEAARWRDAKARVEWLETIEGGPGYRIKKLRYEALPGLWIPALLYEPEKLEGRAPVVLNVNGHDTKGKAADYKQIRCINQAKRGMIALNAEWFGMGQLSESRHDLINHIDLCGVGGIATHYLAMARGLDLLLAHEHADPARVAVTGLSGGGWQTIFISAFDTRVTLTDPVAGYSSFTTRLKHFSDLGDAEQTPCDLGTVTDYSIMTGLMAPRATLLTFNAKDDCCFAADHALPPLLDAARPVFRLLGKEENLRSHVNHDPGTHNYLVDNRQALYRMLGDHFFAGDKAYDPKEIPSDKEVKTADELKVALPDDNLNLHSLALHLSRELPRDALLPKDQSAARSWRDAGRGRLKTVVRAKDFVADAQQVSQEEMDGTKVTLWKLKAGPSWSIPAVELVKGEPKGTTLLVADAGRKESAKVVKDLLGESQRVLVVDPFYVGEAQIAERAYLFALLLATVGDRPLGLQASEIAAVARWADHDRKLGPVSLLAVGSRTSIMALVAAGLEENSVASVELRESYGSLKELIETKASYSKSPELFCFGLLSEFDVVQLAALVAPRPVVFAEPNERARKELAGLKAWYASWGKDHNPMR